MDVKMEDKDSEVMLDLTSIARKYINDHNNPIVKLEVGGNKYLSPLEAPDVKDLTEKRLSLLKTALQQDRVDRRCARAKGIWLRAENRTKITKIVGFLANFGYQDKSGKFLYPDETLFLLETNRLDLLHENLPISIEEGFRLLLSDTNCVFKKYIVYKKLVLDGYKLAHRLPKSNIGVKRKLYEKEAGLKKHSKINVANADFCDVFEKLRQNGPHQCEINKIDRKETDYFMSFPTSSSKRGCDFKFRVQEKSEFNSIDFSSGNIEDICGICVDSSVSFYRFAIVHLPTL